MDESHDLGYGLRKEFWGRETAAEAGRPVLCHGAVHDANNPRSGNVMKRPGKVYQYSYVEQWQPKNIPVTFRMYQLNFDGQSGRVYKAYWNRYPSRFIEKDI